jgi:hypothetical protein
MFLLYIHVIFYACNLRVVAVVSGPKDLVVLCFLSILCLLRLMCNYDYDIVC